MKGDKIKYVKVTYKYKLMKTYTINTPIVGFNCVNIFLYLGKDGRLTIYKGYAWDGASGPTIDGKSNMRASLVHDALYQLIRLVLIPQEYKKVADTLFYDILLEDGMNKLRADMWREGVEHFGGASCIPGSQDKEVLIAP